MNEPKEFPPVEQSLKYMAWNIKEISEHLKKLTTLVQEYIIECREAGRRLDEKFTKVAKQEEMPF